MLYLRHLARIEAPQVRKAAGSQPARGSPLRDSILRACLTSSFVSGLLSG